MTQKFGVTKVLTRTNFGDTVLLEGCDVIVLFIDTRQEEVLDGGKVKLNAQVRECVERLLPQLRLGSPTVSRPRAELSHSGRVRRERRARAAERDWRLRGEVPFSFLFPGASQGGAV